MNRLFILSTIAVLLAPSLPAKSVPRGVVPGRGSSGKTTYNMADPNLEAHRYERTASSAVSYGPSVAKLGLVDGGILPTSNLGVVPGNMIESKPSPMFPLLFPKSTNPVVDSGKSANPDKSTK